MQFIAASRTNKLNANRRTKNGGGLGTRLILCSDSSYWQYCWQSIGDKDNGYC